MFKPVTFAVIASIFMVGCSDHARSKNVYGNQFDLFCIEFTNLTLDPKFRIMTSEARSERLLDQLAQRLNPWADVYVAWEAISSADTGSRYELLEDVAMDVGYDDWSCTAAQQYAHEVGRP